MRAECGRVGGDVVRNNPQSKGSWYGQRKDGRGRDLTERTGGAGIYVPLPPLPRLWVLSTNRLRAGRATGLWVLSTNRQQAGHALVPVETVSTQWPGCCEEGGIEGGSECWCLTNRHATAVAGHHHGPTVFTDHDCHIAPALRCQRGAGSSWFPRQRRYVTPVGSIGP